MKVKSESEVTQLCPTFSDSMDCSLPCSSIHRIFQARVLEWVAIDLELDKDGFRFWPHTQTLTLDNYGGSLNFCSFISTLEVKENLFIRLFAVVVV